MTPALLHLTAALARGVAAAQTNPPVLLNPQVLHPPIGPLIVDMGPMNDFVHWRWDGIYDVSKTFLVWNPPAPHVNDARYHTLTGYHRTVTFTPADLKAMPPGTANEWPAR